MTKDNIYKDFLLGVATGDALGVPVEFKDREDIAQRPVTEMTGNGTYNLPPGTWSDDSSLTFCLAEALIEGFSMETISSKFQDWAYNNYWTPYGSVFDIGIATKEAINRLKTGVRPDLAGGFYEEENGNGSLMRILPLLIYVKDKPIEERFTLTRAVSSVTHGHIRSVIACFYYLEFARVLRESKDMIKTYYLLQETVPSYLNSIGINKAEINVFKRLFHGDISALEEKDIFSSGYVLHTLEASIWCLLTTESYSAAVLKAVNLGSDTDTTGAVTGGLAGILYGHESIPEKWISQLARLDDILDLARRLEQRFG
ncbi:ADP-ribosylglycohydrolase family protein [Pararcticibacter amylolyticus]|uniref:ADP-ribosylglycohydrolase n=1 Tax=Pararcticibacter amylolyticus TaxID=2173175 RepID=A0A2U2PFV5_9SPHI|nr:ADP-ribosylglycohydrolase family protein [Pararcticibacter amylolyticus]PWG80287.1 hypothetical protein DDR33_11770 [Pararcticibacter amylolyticus]